MQELKGPKKLLPIEEGPEDKAIHLPVPGQLSDADEPEPWMPDPSKPKAARKIYFDMLAQNGTHAADAAAGPAEDAHTENFLAGLLNCDEPDGAVLNTGMAQLGQGRPSAEALFNGAQAVPGFSEKQQSDRPQREKREACNSKAPAEKPKTPGKAQGQAQEAAQQMQQHGADAEGKKAQAGLQKKAARTPRKESGIMLQGGKAAPAEGKNAGSGSHDKPAKEDQRTAARQNKTPARQVLQA